MTIPTTAVSRNIEDAGPPLQRQNIRQILQLHCIYKQKKSISFSSFRFFFYFYVCTTFLFFHLNSLSTIYSCCGFSSIMLASIQNPNPLFGLLMFLTEIPLSPKSFTSISKGVPSKPNSLNFSLSHPSFERHPYTRVETLQFPNFCPNCRKLWKRTLFLPLLAMSNRNPWISSSSTFMKSKEVSFMRTRNCSCRSFLICSSLNLRSKDDSTILARSAAVNFAFIVQKSASKKITFSLRIFHPLV